MVVVTYFANSTRQAHRSLSTHKAKQKLLAVAVLTTLGQDCVPTSVRSMSTNCYKMHCVNVYFVVTNVTFNDAIGIPQRQAEVILFTKTFFGFLIGGAGP